jgi:hypothetical protein
MTGITTMIEELLASTPMLDVAARASRRHEEGPAAAAALLQLETRNAIFSIEQGEKRLYPDFQFDADFEPLPAMADILAQVPRGARSWPLLSWLNARNVLLAGSRPRAVLSEQRAAVCHAANQFYSIED